MIEIGSWIGMAAMTQSELTIKDVSWKDLGQIPDVLENWEFNWKKGEAISTSLNKSPTKYKPILMVLY